MERPRLVPQAGLSAAISDLAFLRDGACLISGNGALQLIRWNLGGTLFPAERFRREFNRPDLVRANLRGEVPPGAN